MSVGYMTRKENMDALIGMIRECYVNSSSVHRIKIEQNKEKPQAILDRIIEQRPLEKLEPKLIVAKQSDALVEPILEREFLCRSLDCREVRLRQICVFPIKSCGAYRVTTHWPLTRRGLKYDREWMIVQANGVVMTQKNDTKLCLIRPLINEADDVLELHYPYANSVRVPLKMDTSHGDMQSSMCQTKVCGDRVDGVDCGNEVADWLEDVLCTSGLRLIRQNANDKRKAKKSPAKSELKKFKILTTRSTDLQKYHFRCRQRATIHFTVQSSSIFTYQYDIGGLVGRQGGGMGRSGCVRCRTFLKHGRPVSRQSDCRITERAGRIGMAICGNRWRSVQSRRPLHTLSDDLH